MASWAPLALGRCAGSCTWRSPPSPSSWPSWPPGHSPATLPPRGLQLSCRVALRSPLSPSEVPAHPAPLARCEHLGGLSAAPERTGHPEGREGAAPAHSSLQGPPSSRRQRPAGLSLVSVGQSPAQLLRAMVSTTCSSLLRSRCRRACSSFSRAVRISSLYLVI